MKRDTVNYVIVGAAVVIGFGVLVAGLLAITGRSGSATAYHVYYDNVTGVSYGAPVFYEGFRIGQVSGIEPERGATTRYRVELDVRSDWPIPDDSIAQLQSSGLLADVRIGIKEGSSATMLAPGAEIRGLAGGDVFAAVNDLAGELNLLTRERIRPLLEKLTDRVDSLTGVIDENAPALVQDARALMTRLNSAAEGLDAVLGEQNRDAVAASLRDIRNVAAELKTTQAHTNRLLESINATIAENRPDLRQTVVDLERAVSAVAQRMDSIAHHLESSSRNIDEFSREIRRNPNRLLFTPKADDVEEQ
ncbi:MlaD family protein [Chiayiivirga flava]|uniref:Phospholipid/cholesterol/gamma-HCH transport system substrate-binding protein n=1 Tax=Chiayiivirga flava TaxID=659595 RepID=A0A7W8G1B2_9GAMM|nr:MlaD family protein [Chiayiivirga flava]MBB5208673.1 phospholipid/cholesterol/gamma-HCH transport system substrate-binding protein [Chiayiivirga flava]